MIQPQGSFEQFATRKPVLGTDALLFPPEVVMPKAPKAIKKRDGSLVTWDSSRILKAIRAAGLETNEFDDAGAVRATEQVLKVISIKFANNYPTVEDIQDVVEQTLIALDFIKTARAYIRYRAKHENRRKDMATLVEVESTVNEYLKREDWRVNANANQGYSLGGLILNISGKIVANYWLSQVYTEKISEAHRAGDMHIHDLDMYSGYCAGWSLRVLLDEGFNGVPGKIEASPPKHLSSAIGQMVNFLGTLQNEWAGAQAFSSFDTYLAPYARVDNLSYDDVKQQIQEFIYNLNVPSRWGTQTPFTNVTFDIVCPPDLRAKKARVGGKELDFEYGDCQVEMDMINKAYLEVMTAGDSKGRIFTFPIPTYNITDDFDWDSPNADLLFEMTAKYGIPYFQNFLNSDLDPNMVRSMCCRLQLDLTELLKRGNGLFGSAEMTGSLGVVTLNCGRLGYTYSNNFEGLVKRLDEVLDLAYKSLELKRKEIEKCIKQGLLPFTKRYLGTLRNHFSTIGVNGINELVRNFSYDQEDITSPWGQKFALDFLDHIRKRIVEFQETSGHLYNLEATPAEGATYRFAKTDKKMYPGIIQSGNEDAPFYTNSSQLPVGCTDDVFLALTLQEELQRRYTGGTVFHMYVGEAMTGETCKKAIKSTLQQFRIPYITMTPTFSICPTHGYLQGEEKLCPKCAPDKKQECEIWTRVMGYYRPVSQFNIGKKAEYADRKCFQTAKM